MATAPTGRFQDPLHTESDFSKSVDVYPSLLGIGHLPSASCPGEDVLWLHLAVLSLSCIAFVIPGTFGIRLNITPSNFYVIAFSYRQIAMMAASNYLDNKDFIAM
jgi:hypothetical protein